MLVSASESINILTHTFFPDLQVIGSLPKDQQEEAKCFMQARIERLHEMQAKEDKPRWFEPPTDLPAERARIDQGFLVTPPLGLEVGYVPVSVYSKLREKPSNCDVVEGDLKEEPDPLPANYFTTPDFTFWLSDNFFIT